MSCRATQLMPMLPIASPHSPTHSFHNLFPHKPLPHSSRRRGPAFSPPFAHTVLNAPTDTQFPWSYSETETAYLLEGEVIVTPEGVCVSVCVCV